MKNRISIVALICSLTLVSCTPTPPCETPVNGFLTGSSKQVKMGNEDAVKVFKQLDSAWANLDYDKIKTEVVKKQAEGNNYEWTTNYAFALSQTDDGDDKTTGDVGDWVNAQFTSKTTNPDSEIDSEVYYEYYHIIEGKVTQWNQFKKIVKK
jgi:hypothetical protein